MRKKPVRDKGPMRRPLRGLGEYLSFYINVRRLCNLALLLIVQYDLVSGVNSLLSYLLSIRDLQ